MAYLMALNGAEAGKRYELVEGECILGRNADCDIVIDVGAVSRQHCKIRVRGSECVIDDLKSRNGTFLNDEAIEKPLPLVDGDHVRICGAVFKFNGAASTDSSPSEESRARAVLVDDSGSSTIIVLSGHDGTQLAASAEAKLNALIEITRSLGRALALDEVLPQVLDSLFRIFVQADRGFIGLIDEHDRLIPRWTKFRHDTEDTIRISRTIANQVLLTKEAILSSDASNDMRFEFSQSIVDFHIRSMMCAPLVDSDGVAIGMLQIDTMDQAQRFVEQDLALLVSAAAQASITIDNARHHEESLKQQALARDVQVASEVQRAFLPDTPPDIPGYDFFDYYEAAHQIGGDYYDYLRLPNGRLAVVVADVVGHGIAAAMLMAQLSAETRFCVASESSPAAAVTRLNSRLCQLRFDRFVTLILAVVDPEAHRTTIVNAGHMPPLYRHSDGKEETFAMAESGFPMGIVDGMVYKEVSLTLQPGESLTLFTDGIPEAMNQSHEPYGMPRMRTLLANSDGSPRSYGEALLESVRAHLGGRSQDDDMCLVVLRRIL